MIRGFLYFMNSMMIGRQVGILAYFLCIFGSLFSTICRIYSSKRWNFLKNKVKIQLNCKETFIHAIKSGILTFIERLKR